MQERSRTITTTTATDATIMPTLISSLDLVVGVVEGTAIFKMQAHLCKVNIHEIYLSEGGVE